MPPIAAVRARAVVRSVSSSQLALVRAGFIFLAAAGRSRPPTSLRVLYPLPNTVGRGVFAAVEPEPTRAVSAARTVGDPRRWAAVALLRRTLIPPGGAVLLFVGGGLVPLEPTLAGAGAQAAAVVVAGTLMVIGWRSRGVREPAVPAPIGTAP